MNIDWTLDLELDDGTPLTKNTCGTVNETETAIDVTTPDGNSTGWVDKATRRLRIDGEYDKRLVRNRTKIDLSFQVNDLVKAKGMNPYGYPHEVLGQHHWRVIAVLPKAQKLRVAFQTRQVYISMKDVEFACHNSGAPFEKITFDPDETYWDGYFGGLRWGMLGKFYVAGGPGGLPLCSQHGNNCRHQEEHDRIDKARNNKWREGWSDGQAEAAARLTKRLDMQPGTKFQVRKEDGTTEPAKVVSINSDILTVSIESLNHHLAFRRCGAPTTRSNPYILENIPMTATKIKVGDLVKPRDGSGAAALLGKNTKHRVTALDKEMAKLNLDDAETFVKLKDLELVDQHRRVGYGIFGQTHTSLFDTLEEVSAHWWKTRKDAGTGQFIMSIRQRRPNGHSPWETVSTSGPLEPLPETKVRYQRIVFGIVSSTYDDNLSAARGSKGDHQVLKLTSVGGKVTEVELLS